MAAAVARSTQDGDPKGMSSCGGACQVSMAFAICCQGHVPCSTMFQYVKQLYVNPYIAFGIFQRPLGAGGSQRTPNISAGAPTSGRSLPAASKALCHLRRC